MKYRTIYISLFVVAIMAFIATVGPTTFTVIGTDTNQMEVEIWKYQGHDMLKCTVNGHVSICHSPECKKCLEVFD